MLGYSTNMYTPPMATEDTLDFNFSDYSTITTTMDGFSWNNWSPAVELEDIPGGHDDFQKLFQSLMAADDDMGMDHDRYFNSTSTNLSTVRTPDEEVDDDFKGLRLVHLLTAAAEAISGDTKRHKLASVILTRLQEIVSSNSVTQGTTNMERLAAHFTSALQGLLTGHRNRTSAASPHRMDFISALQLTQNISPYVNFGHFTANQAIVEAVKGYKRVHVVDYDITEGIQWSSLMQALVSSPSPPPHLRITALSRPRLHSTVQETGRRLTSFAESIGLSFSFHLCKLDSDDTFRPSLLKLVHGEALIFNFMLHSSPSTSFAAISSVLSGAKTLKPQLLTLVEEEAGCSATGGSFVGRFMDSLHHYSAIYDSFDAGFPMQDQTRGFIDRVFLGPKIAGTLGRIYHRSSDDDNGGSWSCRLGSWFGFESVEMSFSNQCQSKLLLGLFNDGYRVELLNDRLVLSWKTRQLVSASIWTFSSDDSSL